MADPPPRTHTHATETTHLTLTHAPLDPAALLAFVRRPAAGAAVLFAGSTRETSRPEGVFAAAGPPVAGHGYTFTGAGDETQQAPSGPALAPATGASAQPAAAPAQPPAAAAAEGGGERGGAKAGYAPIASLTYSAYAPLALRTLAAIAGEQLERHGLLAVAVAHRLGEVPVGEDSVLVAASAAHRAEAWAGAQTVLEEVKARLEVWKWEVFRGEGDGGGASGVAGWRSNRVDG